MLAQVARDEQMAVAPELFGGPVQDDLSVGEDIAPVGHLEREVNVLLDDTSSHAPTPAAYVSRSYVLALANPVSPAASNFTR